MAQKIKFNIIKSLFALFSFLADKTNGLAIFAKPKILLGSVIIGLTAFSPVIEQPEIKKNDSYIYSHFEVQKKPEFPGGEVELYKFISENLKYPPGMAEYGIQGKVYVQFFIGENGSVSGAGVVKSTVSPDGDKEAIRLIESMPNWIPGEQNDEKVMVRYLLPIHFKLQ